MLSRHLHLHLMFCVSHLESIWYKLYPNHIVPPPPLDLDLVLELRWNFFGGQRLHAKNYITWFIGQILVGALVIDESFQFNTNLRCILVNFLFLLYNYILLLFLSSSLILFYHFATLIYHDMGQMWSLTLYTLYYTCCT